MSYLDNLNYEVNLTSTLNGAVTHATTDDACLDLFAVAGGMRYRNPKDAINLFTKAYIENPDLAMKLLFYIRDIRQGMGERQLFRNLMTYVAKTWPESAKKNVHLISEYGRFDDLLCLKGTPAWPVAVDVIKDGLEKDLAALECRRSGDIDAHISLLAKWLPSINTSSHKTRETAAMLAKSLGMSKSQYRKILSVLRANISITERKLSNKEFDRIEYESVPASAMLKYRNAFASHDNHGFKNYLSKVENGNRKIHCETLFPYEIIRPIFGNFFNHYHSVSGEDVLEMLWKNLPKELGNDNAICVVDTSGSMYSTSSRSDVKPALISQALGLYHAERAKGPFHNHFITFESTPHLIEVKGSTLRDKLLNISTARWGFNTNIEAVFSLILDTAVKYNSSQEEMPSVLYIISDMEFDQAIRNPSMTIYDQAKEEFNRAGYELPTVVFINVNSWQMQAPVKSTTRGAALVSGAGIQTFKKKFDGNVTPLSHMLEVLNGERYKDVCA